MDIIKWIKSKLESEKYIASRRQSRYEDMGSEFNGPAGYWAGYYAGLKAMETWINLAEYTKNEEVNYD